MNPAPLRVGYVVERYPRFSETCVVSELIAHEAAGHSLELFSLYPPNDMHFQDVIAAVRTPVTYLADDGPTTLEFWDELKRAVAVPGGLWAGLAAAHGAAVGQVFRAARLALLARQRGLGLLHAHSSSAATEVARLAARWASVPFTFTARAKDVLQDEAYHEELRRELAEAASVLAASDFDRDHLRRQFGADATRVRRLYDGLPLDRFQFVPPHRRAARVVAVGRLVEEKGFGVLVAACAQLAAEGRAFHCEIIGTGDQEAALRSQIDRLGLARHVTLLGPRPQPEMIRRVQAAAVLAAPCVMGHDSAADAMPRVLMESMALGTPCVATDIAGIPELVRGGETGLLVAQADPEALARALARLLDNPALRLGLARAARDLVEREFDIRGNAAVQWEIFERAAEGGRTMAAEVETAAAPIVDLALEPRIAPSASREPPSGAHEAPAAVSSLGCTLETRRSSRGRSPGGLERFRPTPEDAPETLGLALAASTPRTCRQT